MNGKRNHRGSPRGRRRCPSIQNALFTVKRYTSRCGASCTTTAAGWVWTFFSAVRFYCRITFIPTHLIAICPYKARWVDPVVDSAPSHVRENAQLPVQSDPVKGRERTMETPSTAQEAKEKGNVLYREKDYTGAIAFYSLALADCPRECADSMATILCNRAAAHYALDNYSMAVDDCTAALSCDGSYIVKALHRRLQAHEKLGQIGKALNDARRLQELDANWPNIDKIVGQLQRISLDPQHALSRAHIVKVRSFMDANRLREARQQLLSAINEVGDSTLVKLEAELEVLSGSPLRPKPGDFDILGELGDGNFSKIYLAAWKKAPNNTYAIKVIELATVERMQRRHRNINNEILMEKRVLNKMDHPNIVTLLATFKDYGSLYYQMEFLAGGELFSFMQEENRGITSSVGTHQSIARFICAQAINALEYMHRRGIVHRDIKPENMMLTATGHLKFVDFGTAKDLVQTDLNGPEFVGTPEYMSPATVASRKCGPDADLWALGIVLYQMIVGTTPFAGASPYLAFLRIKRAVLRLPAFVPAETQDLMQLLLTKDPVLRLCRCTGGSVPKDVDVHDHELSYDALRNHPYFSYRHFDELATLSGFKTSHERPATKVAKLSEICLRAVGNAALYLADATASAGGVRPPAGWAQSFNIMKLSPLDRGAIAQYLNRRNCIASGGVHRLFFPSLVDARCKRVDTMTKEYIGFTRVAHGAWENDFFFMVLAGISATGGQDFESELEKLKQTILLINRIRPRFVVVSGNWTRATADEAAHAVQVENYRKNIARISESIPVLHLPGVNDVGTVPTVESLDAYRGWFGADYYGFWYGGVRCLVLNSTLLTDASLVTEVTMQNEWFAEELEQAKLCATHVIIFTYHPWFLSSIDEEDSPR